MTTTETTIGASLTLVLEVPGSKTCRLILTRTWPGDQAMSTILWSDSLAPEFIWPGEAKRELFGIELTGDQLMLINPYPGDLSFDGQFPGPRSPLPEGASRIQFVMDGDMDHHLESGGKLTGPVIRVIASVFYTNP